jgi:hypothetical protein
MLQRPGSFVVQHRKQIHPEVFPELLSQADPPTSQFNNFLSQETRCIISREFPESGHLAGQRQK